VEKAQIESRLVHLREEQSQAMANLKQLEANVNAYSGAIEDCLFWIEQLEKEEKEKSAEK
jgi:septal ring factor EnvC (AmiA/AmiB activator)